MMQRKTKAQKPNVQSCCLALMLLICPLSCANAQHDRTLKIVSWNIANLASETGETLRGSHSRTESDYLYLQETIADTSADIIALQEIGSLAGARRILGIDYEITFESRCLYNANSCQSDDGEIYTAIAYKQSLAGNPEPFQVDEL